MRGVVGHRGPELRAAVRVGMRVLGQCPRPANAEDRGSHLNGGATSWEGGPATRAQCRAWCWGRRDSGPALQDPAERDPREDGEGGEGAPV
ncbi:hypothetical protein NDU88_003968 [Pleurodeles waltl]|uniref:Uncharacterized protein n=1 Tax=Pleurodeles waltl TaxID=8319 RepID=A0AAV7T889_PLEWA|nr:hypothetical protein NDU88_003968 [Pleurodeles waltl]